MLEVDRSQWGPWQKDLEQRVRSTSEIINRLDFALRDNSWKQARYREFIDIYEKFRSTRNHQILLLKQGRTEEAERIFAGVQTDRHAMIREILNELVENEMAEALARRGSTQSQARLYLLLIIILGSIAVLVSIVMAAALVRASRRYQAEQERSGRILRESEERFRKSFEEGPIGMALVGLDFRFMKVNSRLCQMLGYSEDEMKKLTFPDITHPDDILSDVELAGRMFRGEIPNYRIEKRYIKKNGQVLWIGLNASVVRDEAGDPLYGMAMIEDVHERKKTLEALSRSEQEAQKRLTEIEQIYKYAPVGLFIFDREYRFLRINERMAEINGFPIEEHIGKSMWEVVPSLADYLKEVYPIFERGEPVLNVEVHGRTPKAPEIDRDWLASYFPFKSETGEVIGLIGAVLEITDRKRAEDSLRESERKFRILTEAIEDVFWMSTPGVTRMIYISPGYEKIWEMSRESLYENPKSLLEKVHPEDQGRLVEAFREFHAKGKPYQCEYRIVQPGDWVRWILERGFPAYDEKGELIYMAGTCTDITERKMAALALEKAASELDRSNKDLEQFAYAVSHDLQEPLRMIVSFLQLLEKKYRGKLDESADKYIKFAIDSATRSQTMITDMLEYSRVQTRARSFEKREAEEIFETAIGNLRAAISESNAEVTHDPLPSIFVDFSQFVSVFQNLIGNAIKFRRPGVPPKVHVSARDNGTEWLFSVQDNGIGIKPEYIGRLFQIFQRLHGKEYPGTGIGLVTSKRIVERHGGRIWVESEPERGTVFYFAIPRTPQEHD